MDVKVPHEIINKYKIKLFILFGSTGSKFERENSDLDLAFLTENLISREKEYNLLEELMHFYKRSDIDLINLRKADPLLKSKVSREGKVLFEKEGEFSNFQLYAARVYADTKFLRRERQKFLEERVNKI